MKPLKELGREELYDLVWGEAMATLAPKLGISDVGLKKRCKNLGIPTPPRGYWAKLDAGKNVRKPALPESWSIVKKPKRLPTSAEGIKRFEPDLEYDSAVLHGPAKKTYQSLLRARSNGALVVAGGDEVLRVGVAKENILRACILWQHLIQALAERGVMKQAATSTFSNGIEPVEIRLVEKVGRFERPFDPKLDDRWLSHRKVIKVEVPSGFLAFRVQEPGSYHSSSDWTDKPTSPLDDRIEDVADAIVRKLDHLHQKHIAQQIERERWQEEWRRREQAAEERQREDDRRKALLVAARRLDDAESIRRLVLRVTEDAGPDAGLDDFAMWALKVADDLDPSGEIARAREVGI